MKYEVIRKLGFNLLLLVDLALTFALALLGFGIIGLTGLTLGLFQ